MNKKWGLPAAFAAAMAIGGGLVLMTYPRAEKRVDAQQGVQLQSDGPTFNVAALANALGLNDVSGTCTVGSLVSLGTQVCTITNASIAAGSFYHCDMNTTVAATQNALELTPNVLTAGSINIVGHNNQALSLAGSTVVGIKCRPY